MPPAKNASVNGAMPSVSILIPVYNRERYIEDCIKSALNQTFADFEIVVVDNCSTDRTWDICCECAAHDARVKVYRNASNIGPVRNWVSCLSKSRGEYIKILWSDDLIHPDFLSKTIPHLEDESIGFVYSSAQVFESDPENVLIHSFAAFDSGVYGSHLYMESALFNGDVPYSPGCAIFRSRDVKRNLIIDVPNRIGSDFSMHAIGNDLLLFLLTASQYKSFAVVKEPLSYFRSHQSSITASAPTGKIPLHYNLAKAFFVEKKCADRLLRKKFNAELILSLLKFRNNSYGISQLQDFYPTLNELEVDWLLVMRRIMRAMVGKFKSKDNN